MFSNDAVGVSDTELQVHERPVLPARLYLLLLATFLAGFFAQAMLIKYFATNTPFWDEWFVYPPLLRDYGAGHLTWHSLFAQHNEHRILTTRLAFIGLFSVFGEWSVIANMLFSAFLVGCMAAIWTYILQRLKAPIWLAFFSVFILVSPAQYENILWGFQIQFYTLVLSAILGISLIVLSSRMSWYVVFGSVIACFFSTFSIVAGLLTWGVIGTCLLLKMLLTAPSWPLAFSYQENMAKLGVFIGAGLGTVAFYFKGYQRPPISEWQAHSIRELVRWAAMAVAYPFTETTGASSLALAGAVCVQWLVVCLAAVIYFRRRREVAAQNKLVLLCGITLFVSANAIVLGYGRAGHYTALTPRYITIVQWASLMALFAATELLWEARRLVSVVRRIAAVLLMCAVCGAILLSHEYRAVRALPHVRGFQAALGQMKQVVMTYLQDHSSQRQLGDPAPFLKEYVKEHLDNLDTLMTLPQELVPILDPGGWSITGEAWVVNGVYPSTPPLGPRVIYGSWNGSDSHTGRIVSPLIRCNTSIMVLPIAGYPSPQSGNTLEIVLAADPRQHITYTGGDAGELWQEWIVDVSAFRGKDIRIVATDGSTQFRGWLGFGWPMQISRPMWLLKYFMRYLEYIIAATFMCIWTIHLVLVNMLPKIRTYGSKAHLHV